ncbi:EamA family transporter [uncultured Dechloromonas sp.]|uniref:DMT family transporter n=1 Tax=uncultured Dechloromonas sp. TaxID=171719 RepID=UPI0025E63822|nr:EamA family transporter [uncultured Dechloromonas sp.]
MKPSPPRHFAGLALIILSLVWGYNWVVMKQVVPYVDPFDFSALRTLLGAASLFICLRLLKRPLAIASPGRVAVLGLLQTAAFTALIQWALVAGGAGKTAVLVYAMPFWLIPLAWAILDERIRGGQWLAVASAGGGLLLFLEPWQAGGSWFSNLLGLAAGLTWASATLYAKRLRARHDFDLLALTAWQMLFGSLALCIVALVFSSRPIQPVPYFFGALAFNALLATGLAWVLWLYILQNLPAGQAGLSSLGTPAIGVLAGWIELGETPSPAEFAGMLLIGGALAGLYLLALRAARPAG